MGWVDALKSEPTARAGGQYRANGAYRHLTVKPQGDTSHQQLGGRLVLVNPSFDIKEATLTASSIEGLTG